LRLSLSAGAELRVLKHASITQRTASRRASIILRLREITPCTTNCCNHAPMTARRRVAAKMTFMFALPAESGLQREEWVAGMRISGDYDMKAMMPCREATWPAGLLGVTPSLWFVGPTTALEPSTAAGCSCAVVTRMLHIFAAYWAPSLGAQCELASFPRDGSAGVLLKSRPNSSPDKRRGNLLQWALNQSNKN